MVNEVVADFGMGVIAFKLAAPLRTPFALSRESSIRRLHLNPRRRSMDADEWSR